MPSSPLIDSHCHLDCLTVDEEISSIIAASCRAGVAGWVVPGFDPARWPNIQYLAQTTLNIFPAYGVHPRWAHCWNSMIEERLRRLANDAVAIGEIGLDYVEPTADRLHQQSVFRAQLGIAREVGRPVLIHCRRAFADFLLIAREERIHEVGGVMHSFSGSLEVARECCQLGLLIGVAGPLTYAGARRLPRVVVGLGLDHLVLETDAPDLTPEPLRGTRNVPANLLLVGEKVAELCGATLDDVARMTSANLHKKLNISMACRRNAVTSGPDKK